MQQVFRKAAREEDCVKASPPAAPSSPPPFGPLAAAAEGGFLSLLRASRRSNTRGRPTGFQANSDIGGVCTAAQRKAATLNYGTSLLSFSDVHVAVKKHSSETIELRKCDRMSSFPFPPGDSQRRSMLEALQRYPVFMMHDPPWPYCTGLPRPQ